MKMSPITDIARSFDIKSNNHEKVYATLMSWTLHGVSTKDARAALKYYTRDSPTVISDLLIQARFDYPLYEWKIAALKALQGDRSLISAYTDGYDQLITIKTNHPFDIPKIEQPLCLKEGENILLKALDDTRPVMLSLFKHKVGFATRLLHVDGLGLLKERSMLTFRWEYPFFRNPGACINTAICNYANNIIRDATSASRMTFTGRKSEGTLRSIVVSLDDTLDESVMQDRALSFMPEIPDLNFDFNVLEEPDKAIVKLILLESDSATPDNVKELIADRLDLDEETINESFIRITSYLRDGMPPLHGMGSFNHW